MGKDKNKTKNNGLLNFKGMRIEARLKKAFNMIIVIASKMSMTKERSCSFAMTLIMRFCFFGLTAL